jgi:hypothetical protein
MLKTTTPSSMEVNHFRMNEGLGDVAFPSYFRFLVVEGHVTPFKGGL